MAHKSSREKCGTEDEELDGVTAAVAAADDEVEPEYDERLAAEAAVVPAVAEFEFEFDDMIKRSCACVMVSRVERSKTDFLRSRFSRSSCSSLALRRLLSLESVSMWLR